MHLLTPILFSSQMRRTQPRSVVSVAASGHGRRRGPGSRSRPPAARRCGGEETGRRRLSATCSRHAGRWRHPISRTLRRVLYAPHRRHAGGEDSRRRTPPEERRWNGEVGECAGRVALGEIDGVGVVHETRRRVALALPSEAEDFG